MPRSRRGKIHILNSLFTVDGEQLLLERGAGRQAARRGNGLQRREGAVADQPERHHAAPPSGSNSLHQHLRHDHRDGRQLRADVPYTVEPASGVQAAVMAGAGPHEHDARGWRRSLAAVALAVSACATSDDTGVTGTGGASTSGAAAEAGQPGPAATAGNGGAGTTGTAGVSGSAGDDRNRGHDWDRRAALAVGRRVSGGQAGRRRPRRHHGNRGPRWSSGGSDRGPRRDDRHGRERGHDGSAAARAAAARRAAAGQGGSAGATAGRGGRPARQGAPARRVRAGRAISRPASRRCFRPRTGRTSVPIRRSRSRSRARPRSDRRDAFRVFNSGGSAVATVDMAAATVSRDDRRHGVHRVAAGLRRRQHGHRHAAAEGARLRA